MSHRTRSACSRFATLASLASFTSLFALAGCSSPPPPTDAPDARAPADAIADAFDATLPPADAPSPDAPLTDRVVPGDGAVGPCAVPPTADSLRAANAALRGGANEAPLNADGCLRYTRTVTSGVVTHEEVLAAGRAVVVWDHTATESMGRRDENHDGVFEWRSVVTRGTGPADERVVITVDPSGTGATPVRRETYTRMTSRIRVLIESAENPGDPLERETEFTTASLAEPFVTAPTPGTGTGSCTAAQSAQLAMLMNDAMTRGQQCATNLGLNAMANHAAQLAASRGIELRCAQLTTDRSRCAEINHWDAITSLLRLGGSSPVVITIDPDAFFGNPACASNQLNVMWHEILHTYIGLHDGYDPADQPQTATHDRVYACTALCFSAGATKCQCASCLRTTVCDPRCAGFAECTPDMGAQCRCAARPRWYPTLTQCTVECPTGLACAFASCRAVDYSCR